MKILITGGAGFIASHVADAYIKAGHKVVVVDNLQTGFRRNLNSKAKFYKADIRRPGQMEKIFRRERPEIVNHHAAEASVVKSTREPLTTYETNVLGTINLWLAFGKYGRGGNRKFIFASTGGAIYGSPRRLPADEKTPALPDSPYGFSKFLAEEAVRFYSRQNKTPFTILRYANVYGPRQNPKGEAGVVAIFSNLMKRKKTPVIFGDGSKTRDYVYVGDVVRANILALRKGAGETLNIGRGEEISDREIFEAVARATGFRGRPRYAPFRPGEVRCISLDAKLAHRKLGWKPQVNLQTGIRRAAA